MLCHNDETRWYQARLDTPLGGPDPLRVAEAHRRNDPDVLLDCPGTCLKSRKREGAHGFPTHHGILVAYDAARDHVLVRGHGDLVSPRCVWEGTVADYRATWEVD
jgi:hypothetical protein